jgi:biotin transport system substrate-specific component
MGRRWATKLGDRMPALKSTQIMIAPNELLWALIGLMLTIGGNFLAASIILPPWYWGDHRIATYPLGVTSQIGAVLLISCVGGKNAGALSQIAYLAMGLTPWFEIFARGGGLDYWREPSFGYLLGFVPGAWLCGYLAFQVRPRLESLAFSCLCGLLLIHFVGVSYLILSHMLKWVEAGSLPLLQAINRFSIQPLPGQLAIVCGVSVLSSVVRRLMFY